MFGLTLRTKLMSLLVAALVALIVTGGGATFGVDQLRQFGRDIYEKAFVDMGLLSDLQLAFERQQGLVSRAPAEIDLERLAQQRAAFDDVSAGVRERLDRYTEETSDAVLQPRLDALLQKLAAYEAQAAEVYASAESFDSENAIALVAGPVAEAAAAVSQDLSQLAEATGQVALGNVEAMQSAGQFIQTTIVAVSLVLTLLVGGGGYLFVTRSVSRPITDLASVMQRLAEGDNTVEIPAVDRGDEIGAMAKTVQVFKENARENDRLQSEAKDREARTEQERRRTMTDLADRFESTVSGLIGSITTQVSDLGDKGRVVTDAAERTKADAGVVAQVSDQTSTNVQTVATAVEELSASIREISSQASGAMEMTSTAANDARYAMQEAVTLSKAAEEIGGIVQLINDIAEQTNLLALNATIEAARAGETGKGFAVVASEVKSLAGQTGKATEEISTKIKGIQEVAESMSKIIGQVDGGMTKIDGIASGIASAVEEQGAATQEISRNVAEAAQGTREVSQSIGQVDQCARDTGDAVAVMVEINARLAEQARQLQSETDRFLAGVREGAA